MNLWNWFISLSHIEMMGVLILVLLTAASTAIFCLGKIKPENDWSDLSRRVKAWWIMAGVFFLAMAVNRMLSIIFFGLMSFWAFKEYVTIWDTRRADHRALFWAFLAIPIQYYWVGTGWYGMFIIFVPVYMFLFLPMRLVLAGETTGFLGSSAMIQWGIMAFVFGLSHLAFLLNMPVVGNTGANGQSLLLFLVLITEMNDVFQYAWGKSFGKTKILPTVSPNKTWEGFVGGVLTTVVVGLLLKFLTPFGIGATALISFAVAISGFCGDVVMSAVKRDAGIKDFGTLIPGHGGMLDRVDSLCYTAPIFFHIVHYFYY